MNAAITVSELQERVFQFAQTIFGPGREDAAWKKLFEELGEVLKNPRDPMEWGDVFILLLDLARIYDIDADTATLGKLAVIENRIWRRTETGTFQHVPGQTTLDVWKMFNVVVDGGPLVNPSSPAGTILQIDLGRLVQRRETMAPTSFVVQGDPGCYNHDGSTPMIGKRGQYVEHYKYDKDGIPF